MLWECMCFLVLGRTLGVYVLWKHLLWGYGSALRVLVLVIMGRTLRVHVHVLWVIWEYFGCACTLCIGEYFGSAYSLTLQILPQYASSSWITIVIECTLLYWEYLFAYIEEYLTDTLTFYGTHAVDVSCCLARRGGCYT